MHQARATRRHQDERQRRPRRRRAGRHAEGRAHRRARHASTRRRRTIYTGAQVYDNIFSKLIDLDDATGSSSACWPPIGTPTTTRRGCSTWCDNVTFHNGETFTADDVKYTFERILDPKTASVVLPAVRRRSRRVEVASPTQVIFHLKSPFGPFLTNLANNGEIVNQKAIEAKDPARNPVGTGPFKFVEWVQGDHITLEKYDGYFKAGQARTSTGSTSSSCWSTRAGSTALRAGRAQLGRRGSAAAAARRSRRDPSFTYVDSATAGHPGLPGDEHRARRRSTTRLVRQAVAWALDRTQIRDVAYFGRRRGRRSRRCRRDPPWYDGADPRRHARPRQGQGSCCRRPGTRTA